MTMRIQMMMRMRRIYLVAPKKLMPCSLRLKTMRTRTRKTPMVLAKMKMRTRMRFLKAS
jgi:hypothetical protein